ncbi:MAG: lipoprotein [Thiohalocapsa sp.]|nr:lipoprotein [Thiohalocapsa sp.]MCF7990851.1 lipoprotein [Thiohalocapsa sp.]
MHCWAKYLLYATIAVLGTAQMLSACGQKGDLYLPEPPSQSGPPAPAEASPAQQDADDVPEAPAADPLSGTP